MIRNFQDPAISRLSPRRRDMHLPMMEILTGFSLADALALLIRTPATLSALLRGLPDMWVRGNEGGDTWSAFDIMGHLIVGERTDFRCSGCGSSWRKREARQFDPFDRLAQFEEKVKASRSTSSWTISPACEGENLAALQTLNRTDTKTGRGERKHPSLGVVTLSELVATWAVHDLTHIHQLSLA